MTPLFDQNSFFDVDRVYSSGENEGDIYDVRPGVSFAFALRSLVTRVPSPRLLKPA